MFGSRHDGACRFVREAVNSSKGWNPLRKRGEDEVADQVGLTMAYLYYTCPIRREGGCRCLAGENEERSPLSCKRRWTARAQFLPDGTQFLHVQ